ncbi:MAG: DUF1330 domain-containing protein [Rhizobiales bacterium]|nr:DUF1330 domain-containing protein [Hyphomicrobiales bacterium]
MSAYIIFEQEEWDSSWREAYGPPTGALLKKHGGKVLAASREAERIEGDGKAPTVTVLIEFPDEAAAKAWHSDPEYQPLIALRNTGSKAEALMFKGV